MNANQAPATMERRVSIRLVINIEIVLETDYDRQTIIDQLCRPTIIDQLRSCYVRDKT